MTLDELIAAAEEMRSTLGGDTTVLLLTPRGYAYPSLVDGVGFASRDGHSEPVVIIGPGEYSDARSS
jgi:hypothetical protein